MRIGMHLVDGYSDPDDWIGKLKERNCTAAYCPVDFKTDSSLSAEYKHAALENDILISEVHSWSNMASSFEEVRSGAVEYCIKQLSLADNMEASCCVTTAGSVNKKRGPNKENLDRKTFDLIVNSVQKIIDSVKPEKTFFTLECMPWIFPHSPERYLELIDAIDRKQFAVHFDPVNIIYTLDNFYHNDEYIRKSIELLGPYIKSCHAKDVKIGPSFPIEIVETAPGKGSLDYRTFLSEICRIDRDIPFMIEHLKTDGEYREAFEYICTIGKELEL